MGANWVTFGELRDVIGLDMARVLCRSRGGVSLYIAGNPGEDAELAPVIGLPALRALAQVYGGETIVVPNHRKGTPKKRDILRLREQGVSLRDIALRLDVTERYVEYVASVGRPKSAQASLLDIS